MGAFLLQEKEEIFNSPVKKGDIHTEQGEPFPQPLILQNGALELLLIAHDETGKENQR